MNSYSQYQEDTHFVPLVPKKGRLLEIGAFHPKVFSNSRALIEQGWLAVLVEMAPMPLRNLLLEYGESPEVTLIGGAVTAERFHGGVVKLDRFSVTDDAVTTNTSSVYDLWKKDGGYHGPILYPMIPVEALMTINGEVGYDFVSVDTEGSSLAVADEVMCQHVKHRLHLPVVCVEHDSNWPLLSLLIKEHNLEEVHRNGCNVILRAKQ